jgi:hypothetical protein
MDKNSTIERYRRDIVQQLFRVRSFADGWETWKVEIDRLTSGMTDARGVFELGQHLAEIFRTTGKGGRDQSSLSGGGIAWECLVCWYMNAVMAGSRGVVMRPVHELLPPAIRDATCIVYGNAQTNTESDLVAVVFPHGNFGGVYSPAAVGDIVARNARDVTVGIIQCKTNWNDNAQIPMLWDMVYRATGFAEHSVRVGRNGYSPRHFKEFSYSFVTVPSQGDLSKFKAESMAVKRVRGLSGGNYWGHPSRSDVALSISEIFNRNFGEAFDDNILAHLSEAIGQRLLVPLTTGP